MVVAVIIHHRGRPAEEVEALLESHNTPALVSLVARPGWVEVDELLEQPTVEDGRWAPTAVTLTEGAPGGIRAVEEGRAGVQDEGSQLAALALAHAPTQGEDTGAWLDLCAGPGGKAALLGALAVLGMSSRSRQRELAVLRCAGSTVRGVRRQVVVEAGLYVGTALLISLVPLVVTTAGESLFYVRAGMPLVVRPGVGPVLLVALLSFLTMTAVLLAPIPGATPAPAVTNAAVTMTTLE